MNAFRIGVPGAAILAAIFIFSGRIGAAETGFPIYFPDSKLIVKAEVINKTTYLPVKEIIGHIGLPYTDSLSLETLTVRSGANQLMMTRNSALISYNGQVVFLQNSVLREDGRWLAPLEFLTAGLTRLTGTEFRYHPGAARIFAGKVDPAALEMNAQTLGPITRLTLRAATPVKLDVSKEEPTKAVINIGGGPIDPVRERIDHRDRLLRSVVFDDADGNSKLVLDITPEVADVRVTPADNNRVFFIDFLTKAEATTAAPAPAADPAAIAAVPAKPDVIGGQRRVRVIVIDPGHGGMDPGVKTTFGTEKDLTLAMARRLKSALQSRLGATVLLTRDADSALDSEARSAVANNNQANLFISLHIGYSANKNEAASSIFVMKDSTGDAETTESREPLFLPWYAGYKTHRQTSGAAANIFNEELTKDISGWTFPIRTAPLAVLSSTAMPAVLLELGNLNNPVNAQTLADAAFQTKLASSIVDAVQRFAETSRAGD